MGVGVAVAPAEAEGDEDADAEVDALGDGFGVGVSAGIFLISSNAPQTEHLLSEVPYTPTSGASVSVQFSATCPMAGMESV